MTNQTKHQKISLQTQEEAIKAAKATQRPGQSKDQTKLIAQGIQKGIDHYKRQQKAKSRELNKKLHKVSHSLTNLEQDEDVVANTHNQTRSNNLLPWVLLILSWIGFAAVYYLYDY